MREADKAISSYLDDVRKAPLRRSGSFILTSSKGDVIAQLRRMIAAEERCSNRFPSAPRHEARNPGGCHEVAPSPFTHLHYDKDERTGCGGPVQFCRVPLVGKVPCNDNGVSP